MVLSHHMDVVNQTQVLRGDCRVIISPAPLLWFLLFPPLILGSGYSVSLRSSQRLHTLQPPVKTVGSKPAHWIQATGQHPQI